MSARDVDLEFEKAYQRLFSTSAAPPGAGRSSSTRSEPQAKIPNTVDDGSRPHSITTSTSQVDPPRHLHSFDASILAQPRQSSEGKSRPQERTTPTQQVPRSRSLHSPLDALARHRTAFSSKGKARAHTPVETEERHAKNARRSLASPAPVLPHSGSMPYPGSVAYYPYPAGQPSYQVSAPLIAPGSSLASMPGQAVAWTQPIVSAGPMPAIGYPGFSASVTFSQPQFFASPQQSVHQAAVTAPMPDTWLQQHIPQTNTLRAVETPVELYEQQHQQQHPFSEPASGSRLHSAGRSAERDGPLRKRKEEKAAQIDSKAHVRQNLESVSTSHRPRLQAKQKHVQQRKEPWKPQIDERKLHVPKKRGRPRRIREASPEDVKPPVIATELAIRIKSEGTETQPLKTVDTRRVFDGSLPLASDRGCPHNKETHTLFIHSPRRLRWLARLAIARAEQRVDGTGDTGALALDTSQWARWSNSVAARLQNLHNDAPSSRNDALASQPRSQSDAAGLFPRDKRHEYAALRKVLHSAKRTASTRVCIRRLLRYVVKIARAAEAIESRRARRAFLDNKHRAAKLTKHLLRSAKPTPLDMRKMWSVWARAAHDRGLNKDGQGSAEKRRGRVSFAPGIELQKRAVAAEGPVVKMEPDSPSAARLFASTPSSVKREPDSDCLLTPPLAASPVVTAPADAALAARDQAPLFLRRNFRIYHLLGLHLPIS